MRSSLSAALILVTGLLAACNTEPAVPVTPDPTSGPTSQPTTAESAIPASRGGEPTITGPHETLCGDLEKLIEAARKNFPDMRKKDHPVKSDGTPGFEATFVIAGSTACRILTSEAPYPDAYECDLTSMKPDEKAASVIERWAPAVEKCPSVSKWKASKLGETGRAWSMETNDNHELSVQLVTAGDDRSRPTLVVRLNEI